jgi:hypothetical protein
LRFEYFQPSAELCFFVHIILQVCEIWFKILMCICSVRIPSLDYSLFTWNLSIFRFNLAVLLPLWQNLLTFKSMIGFLFYRCVICVKHLNLQLNRVFSFSVKCDLNLYVHLFRSQLNFSRFYLKNTKLQCCLMWRFAIFKLKSAETYWFTQPI